MRGRAAPPHPGIYRVPPPPGGVSVTKHSFVFRAQRKPNAKLENYKAFQDRLTFLNRRMIV